VDHAADDKRRDWVPDVSSGPFLELSFRSDTLPRKGKH